MTATSLTQFLLARFDEDVQQARKSFDDGCLPGAWTHWVIAQSQAKRLIVENMTWADRDGRRIPYTLDVEALQLLALPYADHPDFDESWRG